MSEDRKSICIISFSPIYRDARVLRQIKYLSQDHLITVIGYGPPHRDFIDHLRVKWIDLLPSSPTKMSSPKKEKGRSFSLLNFRGNSAIGRLGRFLIRSFKLSSSCLLASLGRVHPYFYEVWYWTNRHHVAALQEVLKEKADAFHANDWDSLVVAAEAVKKKGGKLIFDAHEYAPLELENRRYWRLFFKPVIEHFLRKYASSIDASTTVALPISRRYREEYGFNPVVVLNVGESTPFTANKPDTRGIRLVHHGGAVRDRELERMIETLSFCDERFTLHFLLIDNDRSYIDYLKKRAVTLAPGRVSFNDPVPPEQIIHRISEYDMGFYLLIPKNYNNLVALPNKFFDYIKAGLPVCIGPSPSMEELVRQYGFGRVAPSFDPREVAQLLNELTPEDIKEMRLAAKRTSREMSAEKEMQKLLAIYARLLGPCQMHNKTCNEERPIRYS
jgi:glycosyltransferase involved in cell wall biosynthesis